MRNLKDKGHVNFLYRYDHHWDIGSEQKSVSQSRIEKARKYISLFVWNND